jgi:hypothetical protein
LKNDRDTGSGRFSATHRDLGRTRRIPRSYVNGSDEMKRSFGSGGRDLAHIHLSWAEWIYWGVAATMVIGFHITILLYVFDPRTIDGHVSVWVKPLKFEASLAIHAMTLALAVGLLGPYWRYGPVMLIMALAFLVACVVEMGWILLQGARAQHSHFNLSTPFNSFMYSVMAFMAVVIVGAAGAIGLAFLADSSANASPALRTAIAFGLIGGTALTLVTAFTIGGRLSPYVGSIPGPDARMMLTGWSLTGGDLRVSHFLATHMIQAVPLFALAIDRLAQGRSALLLILAFGAAWTMATLLEYGVALQGDRALIARASELIPRMRF